MCVRETGKSVVVAGCEARSFGSTGRMQWGSGGGVAAVIMRDRMCELILYNLCSLRREAGWPLVSFCSQHHMLFGSFCCPHFTLDNRKNETLLRETYLWKGPLSGADWNGRNLYALLSKEFNWNSDSNQSEALKPGNESKLYWGFALLRSNCFWIEKHLQKFPWVYLSTRN